MNESLDRLGASAAGSPAAGEPDRWLDGWLKAQALVRSRTHGMPVPAWAAHGFAESGAAAWARLAGLVPDRQGAISIYVHLPFCLSRCPFCDCHATAIPRKSPGDVARYVQVLEGEVARWAALGGLARRPVTTVHLGGGTPHALPAPGLERVVRAVAGTFAADERTEWAVETNCRCLDDEHVAQLVQLGFTRIHVGVQSLQPRLRSLLGRRDSPDVAMGRMGACLHRGLIVSVDMLYGLPGQSAAELLDDLRRLAGLGIHGVSLYRLNHGRHNDRFMVRHGLANRGPDRLYADYRMFMEAGSLLASRGYCKNHFTHFAREADRNLYARHALRGEDLLALGATADGVFGDYYYRNSELPDYLASGDGRLPLQGGGHFTGAERRARRLVTELMSGAVRGDELDEASARFVARHAAAGLLCRDETTRTWKLTDTGSWFIGECTADAYRAHEDAREREAPGCDSGNRAQGADAI